MPRSAGAHSRGDNYFILHSQQLTNLPVQPYAIFIMGVGMSIRTRVGVRRPALFEN
jgi:hypothetical protein